MIMNPSVKKTIFKMMLFTDDSIRETFSAFTPGKSPPYAVVHSRVAPYVIDAARVCATVAPYELKDGFRKSYEQVKTIWGSALKKGIRGLPDAGKA